jgi:hypothetical protein
MNTIETKKIEYSDELTTKKSDERYILDLNWTSKQTIVSISIYFAAYQYILLYLP